MKNFTDLLESEIPKWDMTISLDRLLANLDLAKKEEAAAENLRNDPPKIIFSTTPAVLVLIDGEPKLSPIENSKLMRMVNTPFTVIFDPETKSYFLNGGSAWFTTSDLKGDWQTIATPPPAIAALPMPTPTPDATTPTTATTTASDTPPRIIVATEPTELIVSDGTPAYSPLVNNDLLYMSNTDRDVFMTTNPEAWFVLASGRWYSSSAPTGPWTYVPADKLPASFAQIPIDSAKRDILAFVGGTPEAQDAVLDAQIPQTEAVDRSQAKVDVTYDGTPQFDPIEGTSLNYAVNTNYSVIQRGSQYYCCNDGIWYVSDTSSGPWIVADSVAPEIYTIPPSCPVYNTRFVRVYESTPDVVYVGLHPRLRWQLRLQRDGGLRHGLSLSAMVWASILPPSCNLWAGCQVQSLQRQLGIWDGVCQPTWILSCKYGGYIGPWRW